MHGLLRWREPELGRDADTGGQIKYVLELARALIDHPGVEKVDLVTRLISDPRVDGDYEQPLEPIVPGVTIVRVQKDPNGFLYFQTAKGQVWKQKTSGNYFTKVPFEAEIKSGMLGSFFLVTKGRGAIRVKRVK